MANSLWFDYDLKLATDTPRIHHQLVPNYFNYEPDLDTVIVALKVQTRTYVTYLLTYSSLISLIVCGNSAIFDQYTTPGTHSLVGFTSALFENIISI